MDRTEQKKDADTPVVSPLTKDKTYGERVYSRTFDWGANYWTNLLASAGFSQWAEHGTKPVKFLGDRSPREMQEKLADTIREKDPFMRRFEKKMLAEKPALEAEIAILNRSMARARSLILLMPGFAVMIPAVWLGAKIKPAFVEHFNRKHYGDDAMDDPSLAARHQAIRAEERPTLAGTVVARLGTSVAAQIAAQGLGSKDNQLNKLGKKLNNEFLQNAAIDPITEHIGYSLGGAAPEKMKASYNAFASKHGLTWSNTQMQEKAEAMGIKLTDSGNKVIPAMQQRVMSALGPYTTAVQDLARFISADTVYTLVTALTIHPFVKCIRRIPFMSYKPDVPQPVDTDGDKIKVPPNKYGDIALDTAQAERSETSPKHATTLTDQPSSTITSTRDNRGTLATQAQPQLA